MINIHEIYRKFKKNYNHKNLYNNSKYEINTFEFIEIKKIYKKVNSYNFLNSQVSSWTELFKNSELKIEKIDFFIKDNNYKKFIKHKTIGRSVSDFAKKNIIEGSILINAKDIVILDNSLLALINKNLSIKEVYGDDIWLNFILKKWPSIHNYHFSKIYIRNEKLLKRIKVYKIEKKLKQINQKAILISTKKESNFFHWIFDTMIKLKLFEKNPKFKKMPIIFRDKLNIYQKKMLKIFNINNEIIYTNGRSFYAKNLIIPTTPSPPINSKPALFWLRNKFLKNLRKLPTKNKRIYISRSDAKHRKIINDDEIASFLKRYNFEKLVLSKLSLEEQINNFRCADIIILPHGSGASHLLFAKKKNVKL